jgi:thiamine-phosphate pyrophosphorylase
MTHPSLDFSLYLITDRNQVPPDRTLVEVVRSALEGGVRGVQIREKDLGARELYLLSLELRRLTRRFDARLLINDRLDVAEAVEADGVHLGGASLPVKTARRLLGPRKLIGASAHSLQEVLEAQESGADFVTFGPVFFTPSKARYGAPVGLDRLREACVKAAIPVFALGGINALRTPEIIDAGAFGIALISAILTADEPTLSAASLLESLKKNK